MNVAEFVARWKPSAASERANKDAFVVDLCSVLGVEPPDPKTGDPQRDRYVFEREAVLLHDEDRQTLSFIDLYKKGHFILEAKQGSDADSKKIGTARRGTAAWNIAMQSAFGQALKYSQTIEAPPPFIIITDIGYCFDLYASFDGTRNYRKFPDALSARISIERLPDKPEHVETLRTIFSDPYSLDPSKRAARVTREIAGHIASLARALEAAKYHPELVAKFLMRCLFTMYAEDVELLPKGIFSDAVERWVERPKSFPGEVGDLWKKMNEGGDIFGRGHIWRFNGGLFAEPVALPLTREQLVILGFAAKSDWRDVEPAIFGTLLERALDPKERHRLGAHYTPRAYVERLVRPTIEEPVRGEWDNVRAAVQKLIADVDPKKNIKAVAEARKLVYAFYDRLTRIRVLDPACGSGNFLFVALDLFKRIENEVLDFLDELGETRALYSPSGRTVTPEQFLGIEVKPWAKEITELVLWIGWLQWQIRTRGWASHPSEPILCDYHNIECRDAVLAWDAVEPLFDEDRNPVTRWDGESMRMHPVTGEEIPDESARTAVCRYVNPRKAEWPEADFIVGNPPFLGKLYMVRALGEGYVDALRDAYDGSVPDGVDLVMYWWAKAARLTGMGAVARFGLVTTNSIVQSFNRRVVVEALSAAEPIRIVFAIPDHPWISQGGAAVRIAMTVGEAGTGVGTLLTVKSERESEYVYEVAFSGANGVIGSDLSVGASTSTVIPLQANRDLASMGPALGSRGFLIDDAERRALIQSDGGDLIGRLRPILNGRDLLYGSRGLFVIDMRGLQESDIRSRFPGTYQLLLDRVKPDRVTNRDERLRNQWWLFRRSNELHTRMLADLERFIATVETAKFRTFFFQPKHVLCEHGTISIGLQDAFYLGVLSSRPHTIWSLRTGGTLEDRPRYNKTVCFEPFPFPSIELPSSARIRELGEHLDGHRKRQQELYPDLTITGMYNVLEKLRSGEALTVKEKKNHEDGLVSVLRQIHDDLDAAVFDAYGWPRDLSDEQILERLVALNAERAAEERRVLIRWLRPDFQNPEGAATQQAITSSEMAIEIKGVTGETPAEKRPWSKDLPDQIASVRDLLGRSAPMTTAQVARSFHGAKSRDVERVLQALAALGLALSIERGGTRLWRRTA